MSVYKRFVRMKLLLTFVHVRLSSSAQHSSIILAWHSSRQHQGGTKVTGFEYEAYKDYAVQVFRSDSTAATIHRGKR